MDMNQAERIAEALIREAIGGVSPEPTLESFGGGVKSCQEPSDGGSEDRVTLTRNYWLRGIPREEAKGVVRKVFGNWKAAGHVVDAAPDYERRVVAANLRSKPDDFLMQVAMGLGGQLSVGVTSPCFWDEEPVSSSLGYPAPRTDAELQERQEAMSGVRSVSSQILDSLAGGRPSGEEPAVLVRLQDGSCYADHQWTYTCEDAPSAERAFRDMARLLGERGWQVREPIAEEAAHEGDAVVARTPDDHEAGAGVTRNRGDAVIRISAAWEREWPPPYMRGNGQ
ncbi:hypothetical protein PV405_11555 [Streptomyces sp. ME02-6979-3A]|uniref:Uncharacterized protein n=1 Tax=Streptomyces silvae TaxID=2803812 RepID=A0ABU8A363_9ACTN|nr:MULTISPECIES: hypothetical protein [unclassified Streptomyces]MDX3325299.1 hypothetical protein [Streptomyces sp. ME02-6979-3A]